MKKAWIVLLVIAIALTILVGCESREASMVSHNLSLEADNFNVARQLTVVNCRTDTVLFQMTGNFSIDKEADGDLAVIGEDEDGRYYKHFVYLSRDITYVVEDIGTTGVNKYKYQINFNPNMILPFEVGTVD